MSDELIDRSAGVCNLCADTNWIEQPPGATRRLLPCPVCNADGRKEWWVW